MNQPEPELTASEMQVIMAMQVEMIKYIEANKIKATFYDMTPPYDLRPWEMFFAE